MKYLITTALIAASIVTLGQVHAQDAAPASCESLMAQNLGAGDFTKKRYKIYGKWSLDSDCTGQSLSFGDDFQTKSGPDLKVYLSKTSMSELDSKGVGASSLKIGVLKSNNGAQSYDIPQGINLSEYKSVVIHCEAFSVLWGGFDLPSAP